MRPQARHDEIRRQVKHHIAHVEQRQTCRDLVRGEVEHGAQVVACVFVHGLREADVGADRGAEEVEDPEGGDYAVVEFSFCFLLAVLEGIGRWWEVHTGICARCWRCQAHRRFLLSLGLDMVLDLVVLGRWWW